MMAAWQRPKPLIFRGRGSQITTDDHAIAEEHKFNPGESKWNYKSKSRRDRAHSIT